MMSDRSLERVSTSYRDGYRAGYAGNLTPRVPADPLAKPFADYDYEQGVSAGANDRRWFEDRNGKTVEVTR